MGNSQTQHSPGRASGMGRTHRPPQLCHGRVRLSSSVLTGVAVGKIRLAPPLLPSVAAVAAAAVMAAGSLESVAAKCGRSEKELVIALRPLVEIDRGEDTPVACGSCDGGRSSGDGRCSSFALLIAVRDEVPSNGGLGTGTTTAGDR